MSDSADHVQHLSAQCKAIVGESNVRVMEPLSRHTTFRIGGPCDIYVIPDTYDEVRDIVALCRTNNVPYYILGRGSDLLVSDAGYRGVVIALSDGLVNVTYEGEEITCQAGVTLREASEMACELGLTGFEFACGIPGSIGGGLFMNAGAYDGCIADIVDSIKDLRLRALSLPFLPANFIWGIVNRVFKKTTWWCLRQRFVCMKAKAKTFAQKWTILRSAVAKSSRLSIQARVLRLSVPRAITWANYLPTLALRAIARAELPYPKSMPVLLLM